MAKLPPVPIPASPPPANLPWHKATGGMAALPIEHLDLLPKLNWANGLLPIGNKASRGDKALRDFIAGSVDHYEAKRNFPAIHGTSRLSPHLHFGEISPFQCLSAVAEAEEAPARDKNRRGDKMDDRAKRTIDLGKGNFMAGVFLCCFIARIWPRPISSPNLTVSHGVMIRKVWRVGGGKPGSHCGCGDAAIMADRMDA